MGCQGSGFFALFSGQPAQCGPINNQIQQVRANLDRLHGRASARAGQQRRPRRHSAARSWSRSARTIAVRSTASMRRRPAAASSRTCSAIRTPGTRPDAPLSGTYRTVCVRTCDGYYFPISYSTVPSKFAEDERLCQRLCPATEALLYSHRNPGEDVTQCRVDQRPAYSELPNAFSYRKQFNPACSCRAPGQSWAEALRQLDDQTIERGDIVVTEEKARLLSQPRADAQGKPIRLDASPARPAAAPKGGGPKSAAAAPTVRPRRRLRPHPRKRSRKTRRSAKCERSGRPSIRCGDKRYVIEDKPVPRGTGFYLPGRRVAKRSRRQSGGLAGAPV